MNNILSGIETLLFCDETKFYTNAGDSEDAIYYFAVAVDKRAVPKIHSDFKRLLVASGVKSSIYHSTSVFKESRPRERLMNDLTQFIINNQLHTFCYKYSKNIYFEQTINLRIFNTDILNFHRAEFQALFYFLIVLNTYLRDRLVSVPVKEEIAMYFDRNVYGTHEIEAFKFPSEHFILKQMTFTEKSEISLLSLPDFLGYIFRKSKQSQDKFESGNKSIETSPLVINCYSCLTQINAHKLFTFLDVNDTILSRAVQIISRSS
jgi:hypothetical protein